MTYVATFFSHFGAIRYQKLCREQGIAARTMPVPRSLSAGCGIAWRVEAAVWAQYRACIEQSGIEIEQSAAFVR